MKTYPVEIYGYRRLGDNGCSITLHTTLELKSKDIMYLDEHRGKQCVLVVTDVTSGLDVPELDMDKIKASMVENKVYNKNVSPSERQRRKIWVLYTKKFGKEPSKEEFESFYMEMMDKIDTTLVNKISSYELK